MNGRVNNKIWPAIWVFVLFLAGFVWNCGTVSGAAGNVYPVDGSVILGSVHEASGNIYTFLDARADPNATSYVCYFSHIEAEVAGRVEDANIGPQISSVPNLRWIIGLPDDIVPGLPYSDGLVRGTKYYWAVDAFDAEGNKFAGDVWAFGIQGYYAFGPDPPDEAVDIETDVLLSWIPGLGACRRDVYIGTNYDDVLNADEYDTTGIYKGDTFDTFYQCSNLAFNTKYYWRIDELSGRSCCTPFNACMISKGDVWSFTTEAKRIFVDVDAAGANNGASWENAYNYLQDALIEADSALKPVEICVAEGIYKPDRSMSDPNGSGSRAATFQLINGVTLKGGYAGVGEPNPNAWDINLYETILSGDLDGNDVDVNNPADLLDEPTRSENSYHVVTGSNTDSNAVLDGFTITGGNANENYPSQHANGGGMYNYTGSPTVTNCSFIGNRAGYGGGILNSFSNPTITNCTFSGNWASAGGGMSNWENSNLTVSNCIFSNNTSANLGGGMYNYDSSPIVTNSSFIGNSASFAGGGMCNITSGSPTVTNCIFSGNSVSNRGGGIGNFESDPFVINCILWGDTPDEIWLASGTLVITYSDVQSGTGQSWFGTGCIDVDPCFVDAAGGDFRLSSDSPCIDAGDNNAPNLGATDMDGHPRIIDGDCNDTEVVDMGAYEFNYAYMGDFDYSCDVDFADYSIIALAWLTEPGDHNWDPLCNIADPPDSLIDWRDVAILCDNWLADNNPNRYCIVEDDVRYCIRTDKSVYHLGETVGIFYRITNPGSVPVNLGWAPIPPFCYHFSIVDNNGEHVWQWSWEMPPMPPVEFLLDAYESKGHEIGWEMINDNGTYGTEDDFPIGPGVYKITGELLTGSDEDRVKVSVSVNVRE